MLILVLMTTTVIMKIRREPYFHNNCYLNIIVPQATKVLYWLQVSARFLWSRVMHKQIQKIYIWTGARIRIIRCNRQVNKQKRMNHSLLDDRRNDETVTPVGGTTELFYFFPLLFLFSCVIVIGNINLSICQDSQQIIIIYFFIFFFCGEHPVLCHAQLTNPHKQDDMHVVIAPRV